LQAAVLQTSLMLSHKDIRIYEKGGEYNVHGRDGNSYKILARNLECKPRYRWKNIIKLDLRCVRFEGDWTKDALLDVWKRQLHFRFHQGRDFLDS
jgi:hypothetical protein